MPIEPANERGFSTHGGGTRSRNSRSLAIIQNMDEVRHRQALIARLGPHGELVAEVACRSVAHAGHAQMLAQSCSRLHVEVVERNDAIDVLRSRHVADAKQHVVDLPLLIDVGDIEDLVDAVARPILIGKAVRREQ